MEVGHRDLCIFNRSSHVLTVRYEIPAPVDVGVSVWDEVLLVTVPDGDSRGQDGEPVGESPVPGAVGVVDALPDDREGYHGGLTGSRGHLDGHPAHVGVVLCVDLLEHPLGLAVVAGDLGEVDEGFDGLDLGEEEAGLGLVRVPVVEELLGDVCDSWITLTSPHGHVGGGCSRPDPAYPAFLGFALTRLVGLMGRDVVLIRGEVDRLMSGLLTLDFAPTGTTRLDDWLTTRKSVFGGRFVSDFSEIPDSDCP